MSRGQDRTRGAPRRQTLDELMARAQERHEAAREQGQGAPREFAVAITGDDTDECFCLHVHGGGPDVAIPLHATQLYELWHLLAESFAEWHVAAVGMVPLGVGAYKHATMGLAVRVTSTSPHNCVRVTVQHEQRGSRLLTLHVAEVTDLQAKIASAYSRWQTEVLAVVLARSE